MARLWIVELYLLEDDSGFLELTQWSHDKPNLEVMLYISDGNEVMKEKRVNLLALGNNNI
jgi:hypothetical protein